MGKGTGSTKSTGASAPHTSKGSSLSKAQVEERMGMSERMFFNTTGMRYGHFLYHYQDQLDIANRLPDNADMFTGHKAGEVKKYLKKIIKIMGG